MALKAPAVAAAAEPNAPAAAAAAELGVKGGAEGAGGAALGAPCDAPHLVQNLAVGGSRGALQLLHDGTGAAPAAAAWEMRSTVSHRPGQEEQAGKLPGGHTRIHACARTHAPTHATTLGNTRARTHTHRTCMHRSAA